MPIEVGWDVEARDTIVIRYRGPYTWEELDRAVQQTYDLLKSVSRPIDMIVVLDATAKAPTDGDLMGRFRSILKNTPDNLRTFINVGRGNLFSRAIVNVVLKIYPSPFEIVTVATEEDARHLLRTRQKLLSLD